MFIPIWALIVAALAFLVLLRLALRGRGTDDMIEQQRRHSPPQGKPGLTSAEEAALLARPEIANLIVSGNKTAAIRAVREASGLGLRA